MSTIELPRSSKIIVLLAVAAIVMAFIATRNNGHLSWWVIAVSFLVSGYLSDLFTGIAHFCFDYVFPYKAPIVGPISREFTNHHDHPTLDPSNYLENLTKGAYGSIPVSLLAFGSADQLPATPLSSLFVATLVGMSVWAFFFHQIHSYAHMGHHISPDVFKTRVEEIALLSTKMEQIKAFRQLFDAAPIPRPIRLLQTCRVLLTPERHNIHHISFESDFSSVNGWSDPLLNLIVRPLAKRYKSMVGRER